MKLFISVDFEGVSGVVAWEQAIAPSPELELGRELVLGELNAAIHGARSGGATEIVVNDAHHSMRNLDPSRITGRAIYISGRFKPLYMMQGLDGSYDGVFFLGYHGAAGGASVLSHTYSPSAIWEVRLNGEVTGEAGINALVAQAHGVPVALITGDEQTAEEARRLLPGVRSVQVKSSISRFAASNLHPEAARDAIRRGAAHAVRDLASIDPRPLASPARLEITFLVEDMARMATWITGVERTAPRTVVMEDTDTLALYERFVTILYLVRALADS